MALIDIVAIALVDDDTIAYLHDASLNTLQVVACTCQLDEQEEVDHRVTSGLALSYANSLHEYLVEACGLAKDNGLTRLASHTSQRTRRWTRTNEGIRMRGEFLHTRLITQNGTLGALGRGVDGQDCQLATLFLQHVDAKLVNRGGFTSTWYSTNAHTDAVTTIGQTFVDDLLRLGLMVWVDTLYQRDSLRQDGDIALDDAFNHLGSSEFTTTETTSLQIGIDERLLVNTTVDLQACIF